MTGKADLRIVLIGLVGAGKTTVMNNILREEEEEERGENATTSEALVHVNSYTEKCQMQKGKINGQNVIVVDTPGLGNAEKKNEEIMEEIKKCFSLASPGPHAFLFVQRGNLTKSWTHAVEIFKQTLSDEVLKYTMILFTHGDGKTDIQQLIKENQELDDFVSKCKNRYHIIDNTVKDPSQVTELLREINNMVEKNGGKHYTEKEAKLRNEIKLAVSGSAVAGAGFGGAVSHFVGSTIGIVAGVVGGALVGAGMGAAGIVTYKHIKAKMKGSTSTS